MKKFLYIIGMLFLFSNMVYAGIPVEEEYWAGSRTTPSGSGIDSTGGYTDANGGFKISWEISYNAQESYWEYSYTVTDKDDSPVSPDVSHWILEISPEVDFENIGDYVFDANATVVTPPGGAPWPKDVDFPNETRAGSNNGNPNLGTNLNGIKFDNSASSVDGTYSFKSIEPPVWGDFYIK